MRSRKLQGYGWERWSKSVLYEKNGSVRRLQNTLLHSESVTSTISHINFDMKVLGERSAGNPHATFEVAGAGNGKDGKSYMSTKLETMDIDKLIPVLHRASSRPYLTRENLCERVLYSLV